MTVDSWHDRMAAALDAGWRFGALYATSGGIVRALLVQPDGETLLETASAEDGAVPSIVDLVPAAGWDEREAHDLYGVEFTGHDPLRPLVDHGPDLDAWTVPVHGQDAYQVAVGPIHAGVIESGHFRFHVVGDRILHVDARLFYKHRGLEKAVEGVPLEAGIAFAGRACGACAVANSVAYALACEAVLGLRSGSELARSRTILLELERVWSHLNDIAAVCSGTGLAAGNSRFAELTERARRLNATLTGHRFLFGTVRVGGSDVVLDEEAVRVARTELTLIREAAARGWRELAFNSPFQDRLPDIGIVDADDVALLGSVGPAARAAGVAEDVRSFAPALDYLDFEPVTPTRAVGDVRARFEQRALELWQSFDIVERLLDRPLAPAVAERGGVEREIGVGRVESSRGATTCVVEQGGGRVERLHLRTGSYANWPAVAHAAANDLFPDFPLINKSFELCYACADR